jgi:PPOX class probable F420-dependent enzyme
MSDARSVRPVDAPIGISLDTDVVDVLVGPDALSFLSTVNADGSPQVTLVRPTYENGEVLIAHTGHYQKIRNMRREPRVVLATQAPGGFDAQFPYLTINGWAYVTEGGAMELLHRIIEADMAKTGRQMPERPAMPADAPPPPPGFVTHIIPLRVGGRGPWSPTSPGLPPSRR